MGHCWTPAHPTQDSPGTGTQKQLSWCPWGGTPSKGIPWPLYPTLPPQVSLFLPSLWLLLHLCVHPLCWLHCSSSPLVSKGSAIPSSCCVTHYLFIWLESPVFHARCYPKAWLLMASCLRLPHRAQSAFQSASQFSGWATWTRSMLSSMRNLIDVCSNS